MSHSGHPPDHKSGNGAGGHHGDLALAPGPGERRPMLPWPGAKDPRTVPPMTTRAGATSHPPLDVGAV
ncbi:MAG: hypothetical protein KA297_23540, partial [Kofleriaceae bacterium]|nr:hypothetical protein [Kofleriaceae bacterium]